MATLAPCHCDGKAEVELAPRSDWSELGECQHFVQFYDTSEKLLDSVSGFVSAGIAAGDTGIVVATPVHRSGIEKLLRAQGLDIDLIQASGLYLPFDADELLAEFVRNDMPDPILFREALGGVLCDTKASGYSGGKTRVYGEMVAVLWAQENYDAAILLEELWNDLLKSHSFSLFCSYPAHGMDGEALASPLHEVCARHARVIPAESYNALSNADERLRAIVVLQQKANSLQAEVAQRKQATDALQQALTREHRARSEAEQANRLKDEFLATVSHELRTPLNAIIGWSCMLREGGFDEKTLEKGLGSIERNAKAQAQLIEDLLDITRASTGQLLLAVGQIDLALAINSAIDTLQFAAKSKGVSIEIALDPSGRHVAGDEMRLQQVMWNLISNAIKFTPRGGRIDVRLARDGSDARISVSDTGQGFSPDFAPYIFDRFRQADGSTTRCHGGLGLGLAIVRHLVELHGGTISAESAGEGAGATFTVRLPLKK